MISTTRQKAKFKSFVRQIRNVLGAVPVDVETIAIGLLERLWHTTANDAFRGDIGKLSNDEIAESIGWFGDADQIVEILVATRWIDRNDQCRLVVHDWAEHCPTWVKGNVAKYGGFIVGGSYREAPDIVEEAPIGSSPREAPLEEPTTKPSQAYPSLAKPSLSNPAAASLAAADLISFVDAEEVRIEANKLLRACPTLEKVFLWQVAWVATAFDRGLCGEFGLRLRDKSVQKPRSYLAAAMRSECEKRGFTWADIVRLVPDPPPVKTVGQEVVA